MSLAGLIENQLRLRESGWWNRLCEIIPELRALPGTPQPAEHHAEGDVAIHTRLAVAACPVDCDPDLLWVALLHDIGKPATTQQDATGRITAHGHAKLGAAMAADILGRLGMCEQRRARIVWVIRHHGFHHSWQLTRIRNATRRQLAYVVNPAFPLLLEFLRVDTLASHGKRQGLETYDFYCRLLRAVKQHGPGRG